MKYIYLDNAATTPVDPQVLKKMMPYFSKKFGNASSLYGPGREARLALNQARTDIADILGCKSQEIYFTNSGTASDNLAILGAARANKKLGNHIITTVIEHKAVLKACAALKAEGFVITYLPVDKNGLISLADLKKAVTEKTILVSVMMANNEIGTIQPIAEIGEYLQKQKHKIIFHTDACQAAGVLDLNVNDLKVDFLTFNGSKMNGPKGIGVLYIKFRTKIEPIMFGGDQERGFNPGTENIASIVGLAEAFKLKEAHKKKEDARQIKMRDKLIKDIQKKIPKVILNGHAEKRLPNNINISVLEVEGEAMLLFLDGHNIAVSTGSACSSHSLEASYVLQAIGVPEDYLHSSLRITLGKETTAADLKYFLEKLKEVVTHLRRISPIKLD